jgi:hypothetical protein
LREWLTSVKIGSPTFVIFSNGLISLYNLSLFKARIMNILCSFELSGQQIPPKWQVLTPVSGHGKHCMVKVRINLKRKGFYVICAK